MIGRLFGIGLALWWVNSLGSDALLVGAAVVAVVAETVATIAGGSTAS